MKKIALYILSITSYLSICAQPVLELEWIKVNGTVVSVGSSSSIPNFTLGNTFSFQVQVKNNGNDSPAGYNNITFGFPNFNSAYYESNVDLGQNTSNDLDDTYNEYFGTTIITANTEVDELGNDGYIDYLTVEVVDEDIWDGNDFDAGDRTNNFEVIIEPDEYGWFEIKFRADASNSECWPNTCPSNWDHIPGGSCSGDDCDATGTNSYSIFVNIVPPPEDYWITNEYVSNTTIEVQEAFTVSCKQYSNGYLTEDKDISVGYFLSANTTYDLNDIWLGESTTTIGSDIYDNVSSSIKIGDSNHPGSYYLLFVANYDNLNYEADISNNTKAIAITVTKTPDLDIVSNVINPPTAEAGSTINWNCTVNNIGHATANSSSLKLYISNSSTTFGEDDLVNTAIQELIAGGSQFISGNITIPASLAAGTYYVHFLADANEVISEIAENNNTAKNEITVLAPQIGSLTFTSPLEGEEWRPGSTHNITWNKSGNVTQMDIKFSFDGGLNWTDFVIDPSDPSSGTYEWTIPDGINSSECQVCLVGYYVDQKVVVISNNFTIKPQTEFYTTFHINDIATGQEHPGDIRVEVFNNPTGWQKIWEDVTSPGYPLVYETCPIGVHPIQLFNQSNSPEEFWGSVNIGIPDSLFMHINREAPFEAGFFHYPFKSEEAALSLSSNPSDKFSGTEPASVGQSVFIPVVVKNQSWTKNVKASIYVNDNQSYGATVLEPQAASISPYGGTTTFVFEYVVPEGIADGTTLNIDVKIEAEYNSGFHLVDSYNGWSSFSVSTAPPQVTDHFPDANAQNVPITTPIEIHFDMDMDEAFVENPANFTLSDGTTLITPDSIVYKKDYGYAVFYPSTDLEYNTEYTVSISANMQNLTGLMLDGNGNGVQDSSPTDNYVFSFTTSGIINEVRLEVPYYAQFASNWCGVTSLSMILSYYGIKKKPWEIAGHFGLSEDQGTYTKDMEAYLESTYGIPGTNCWFIKRFYSLRNLKEEVVYALNNGNPVLLGRYGEDYGHAVIITGYKGLNENDSLFIHDPSYTYPLTMNSYNGINFSSTWQEFINWVSPTRDLILADASIIYSKGCSLENHANLSLEVPSQVMNFSNKINNVYKELNIAWDGSINTEGYYYKTSGIGTSWYPYDIFFNTIHSATQADILNIIPNIYNYSLFEDYVDAKIQVDIIDYHSSIRVDRFESNYIIFKKEKITYQSFYPYIIPEYELCNLQEGNYYLRIKLINRSDEVLDYNEFKFSVTSSSYAKINTEITSFNHQKIVKGTQGIWNMIINNLGTQNDEFWLFNSNVNFTSDTCIYIYNNNYTTRSPIISNNGTGADFELVLETTNIPVGTKDTIITEIQSFLDPNKIKRDTITYEIVECLNPVVDFNLPTHICVGEQVLIQDLSTALQEGESYEWDIDNDGNIDYTTTGDITHIYTEPGVYNVKLTINQGTDCTASKQVEITVHPKPEIISEPTIINSSCGLSKGAIIGLSVSGSGNNFEWLNMQNIVVGTDADLLDVSAGNYKLTITNGSNCSTMALYIVNNAGAPNPPSSDSPNPYCYGEEISPLVATGSGGELTWYADASLTTILGTGGQLILNSAPIITTNYYVTETGSCESAPTVVAVIINTPPTVNLGQNQILCEGEQLTLNPGVFSSYRWSNGSIEQSITVTESGSYWVEVSDINGCTARDTVNISVIELPELSLGNDTIVPNAIMLDPGTGFDSYLWSTGSTNQIIYVYSSGVYSITAKKGDCTISDDIFVTVFNPNACVEISSISQQNFNPNGGTGEFDILSTLDCNWTVSTTCDWVHSNNEVNGSGNETVTFSVDKNFSTEPRSCFIAVQNDTFDVVQEGGNPELLMTYVPDDNFEQTLIDLGYDSGELNDSVPTNNIIDISVLNLNSKNIKDLSGIEDFFSLQQLLCDNNQLISLDLSKNFSLQRLFCVNNQLSLLNLGSIKNLVDIFCTDNQLTSLDVSNNRKLHILCCGNNQISHINLTENDSLESIECYSNKLTELDISQNTSLNYLSCTNNQLTSLDISNNKNLKSLFCKLNQLTTLDLSNNTLINTLWCQSNELAALNLKNGNNDNLKSFDTSHNLDLTCIEVDDVVAAANYSNWLKDATASYSENCSNKLMTYVPDDNFEQALIDLGYDSGELNDSVLTEVIISITHLNIENKNISDLTGIESFSNLTWLNCGDNNLTTMDVSENTALTSLFCNNNQLTILDLSQNIALLALECSNNQLTNLDVTQNTGLLGLGCIGNQLSSVDVSKNSALSSLDCSENQLTSLDVSHNLALSWLCCNKNQLVSIDLTQNTAISHLELNSNQIISLDISNNKSLTRLLCYENKLTDLDVSQNIALIQFGIGGNQLTRLDVSQNTALVILNCGGNQLTSIDVSQNMALGSFGCGGNQIQSLDVSQNPILEQLNCNSNNLSYLIIKNGNNSNLAIFDSQLNPNLTCIEVDNPVAASANSNWTKDATASYSENCSFDCTYDVSQRFYNFNATGGIDSVGITAPEVCDWSVTKDCDWVTINSETNASGNGIVSFSVEQNLSTNLRECYVAIGNDTFLILQEGDSDLYEIKFDTYTASGWFGGDNREGASPRNVANAQSVTIEEDIILESFSFYFSNAFGDDSLQISGLEVDLTLNIWNEQNEKVATKQLHLPASYSGGWATWTDLNLPVTKNTILTFCTYLNGGYSKNEYTTGVACDGGAGYDGGTRRGNTGYTVDDSDLDVWTGAERLHSWDSNFWLQGKVSNHVNFKTDFQPGWNIFSTPIIPDSSNIKKIFQSLIDNNSLVKIQDEAGASMEYLMFMGGWNNTIGDIDLAEGYKVKVSKPDSLEICGQAVEYPYAIPLKAGWNIIGYPHLFSANAIGVLQPLIDNGTLIKAQDESGQSIEYLYFIQDWVDDIIDFKPGEGYKIKVNAADTLWIQEIYTKSTVEKSEQIATLHFQPEFEGNGVDHMNLNLVGIPINVIKAVDELAVYDGETCVGAVTLMPHHISSQFVSIAASAADGQGMKGFNEGNPFTLKLYSAKQNQEFTLEPEILTGTPTFVKHESTVASLEKYTTTDLYGFETKNLTEINCYPNPFTDEVTIEIKMFNDMEVNIEVINQIGQQVKILANGKQLNRGNNRLIWDGTNSGNVQVSNGVYMVRISINNIVFYKKVIFSK